MSFKKETIGDVVELITNGVNCKQNKEGIGVKITRIETIANREINFEKIGFSNLTEDEKNKYRLIKGDILFSHINSPIHVGKTAVYYGSEDLYHGVNLLKLRVKNHINPYYFKYFLDGVFQSGYWRRTSKQSVNQASVNQTDIKKINFFYPSLTEQQRIVAKLDAAFAEIDKMILNTKKSIENSENLYQQSVSNILNKKKPTWQSINIREACFFTQGIQVPIGEQSKIKDDTYNTKFLRIVDFTQGNSEPRYIKNKSKNKKFSKNDIAIVRYGASTGFVCSGLEGQIANNMFQVTPKDNLFETDYLNFFLNSCIFKNFINSKISGAAMPAINFQMFNDFKITFPKNIEERKLLVLKAKKMLEEKNRLVETYENKLINLKLLKLAISSQELKAKST